MYNVFDNYETLIGIWIKLHSTYCLNYRKTYSTSYLKNSTRNFLWSILYIKFKPFNGNYFIYVCIMYVYVNKENPVILTISLQICYPSSLNPPKMTHWAWRWRVPKWQIPSSGRMPKLYSRPSGLCLSAIKSFAAFARQGLICFLTFE